VLGDLLELPLGAELGDTVGEKLGDPDGEELGLPLGPADGTAEGSVVGMDDGRLEGFADGHADGTFDGWREGKEEGLPDGWILGVPEGLAEGMPDGSTDGLEDGDIEGFPLGFSDGDAVGRAEGQPEGRTLGSTEGDDEGDFVKPIFIIYTEGIREMLVGEFSRCYVQNQSYQKNRTCLLGAVLLLLLFIALWLPSSLSASVAELTMDFVSDWLPRVPMDPALLPFLVNLLSEWEWAMLPLEFPCPAMVLVASLLLPS
jgi:hypothetical protein